MNAKLQRLRDSISNAVSFLEHHRLADPVIQKRQTQLQASYDRIQELIPRQDVALHTRDSRHAEALRRALRRRHMLPIAREGKWLLAGAPGAERALRTPHKHASNETLVAAAKGMAAFVRPYAKLFVEQGFEKNFLAELRSAAAVLQQWSTTADTARKRGAAATKALAQEVSRARALIRVIDAHIEGRYHGNAFMIDQWRKARRVPPRMGRPRKRPPPEDRLESA